MLPAVGTKQSSAPAGAAQSSCGGGMNWMTLRPSSANPFSDSRDPRTEADVAGRVGGVILDDVLPVSINGEVVAGLPGLAADSIHRGRRPGAEINRCEGDLDRLVAGVGEIDLRAPEITVATVEIVGEDRKNELAGSRRDDGERDN